MKIESISCILALFFCLFLITAGCTQTQYPQTENVSETYEKLSLEELYFNIVIQGLFLGANEEVRKQYQVFKEEVEDLSKTLSQYKYH